MLVLVMGFPGGFAEWCGAVTSSVVGAAGAASELIEAETLNDLALRAIAAGSADAVVLARRPGGRLRAAVAEAGRSFVVAQDDPRTALLDLVLGRGVRLRDAIRLVAGSCAALLGCAELPGALVLRPDDCRDFNMVAARIGRHLGLPVDEAGIAGLAAAAEVPEPLRAQYDSAGWWSGLDPAERDTAIGALEAYIDTGAADGPLSITWTGELFSSCKQPEEAASAPVDITGRAHQVIEGPHIALPPGAWSLTLTVFCNREAAECEFLVELVADATIASAKLLPEREGTAEVKLNFTLDLAEHPISIRISTVRAAFDGTIAIGSAQLTRSPPPMPM